LLDDWLQRVSYGYTTRSFLIRNHAKPISDCDYYSLNIFEHPCGRESEPNFPSADSAYLQIGNKEAPSIEGRPPVKDGTKERTLGFGGPLARMRALIADFRSNSRGNVAIICALCAIPLVSAVGCVIDYSMASTVRTKLQAAADAASLATVSVNSPIITTAKNMSGNGSITSGSTYAQNFFDAETSAYSSASATATVTKTGTVITASVSFSYPVSTYFMGIVGYPSMTVTGSSTASYTLPTYINFYLMLDVSGSMGMPSTTAEQARLQAVDPDNMGEYPSGCTLACHFTAQGACGQGNQGPIPAMGKSTNQSPGGYCQGFIISRLGTTPVSFTAGTTNTNNGNYVNWTNTQVSSCSTAGTTSCIQLRLDAVGYAVNALLAQASTTETNDNVTSQFQVGLFPFIQNLCTASANSSNSCSVGLTTNLTGATITNFAAELANLLDTGQNSTLGSGGTHFENALSSINSFITSVGTGASSSSALPYVFIVTDGSQDYQTQWNGNWSSQNWSANSTVPYQNSATVITPNTVTSADYCTTMKKRGITVAVLYIPYQTIQNANASFASNEDGYANANIPFIPGALQTCASPNFFYTATTPADIQNALITMFEQAVSTAHVTN
jgi:Flp pilus assembly protein TadG